MTNDESASLRHSSFDAFVILTSSFVIPPGPVSCTLYLCSHPSKSSAPADGSRPGCQTTNTAESNSTWPRPSIGRSKGGIIWWSRRAPAWARASPTSCRPSWPPPAGRSRSDGPRRRKPPSAPRGRLDPHDQPARAVDAEGPAAAEQRDSAGVFGRAGQGAGQLPQPAAAGQRPEPGRQPVPRSRGIRAVAAAPRLVAGDGRRLAVGPRFPPLAGRVGRGPERPRQLHGPHVSDVRQVFLLQGPAADAKRPNPGGQPRPVLHRPGAAAARR